ncbi:MAG: hypothetical protein AAF682_13745 [Planctomycetota bacterium]
MRDLIFRRGWFLAAPLGVLAGCSGGGGSSPPQGGFQLLSISVSEGEVVPINTPIELNFNGEVDLDSVLLGSTIQLVATSGGASAFYSVGYDSDPLSGTVDRTTLIVQPFCPVQGDLSDAGLQPGGLSYELRVPGTSSGALQTLTSDLGAPLELTQTRGFLTPTSVAPADVFSDPVLGPADFLPELSFVRLGSGDELSFVDAGTSFELAGELPLNLYSDASTAVAFLVQLNQPVDPSESNLDDAFVRLEAELAPGGWEPVPTRVELETNCPLDLPGALLRLSPEGLLPQGVRVRVVLAPGFRDLAGEVTASAQIDLLARTGTVLVPGLEPEELAADEVYEDFLGTELFDAEAEFDTALAEWQGGALTAGFDFEGTGGPGGDFDWHVSTVLNFSTETDSITGGPDGVPAQTIPVVGGVIDVDDLWIQPGATLRVQGSEALTILTRGELRIDGTLDLSGFNAKNVGTLFTPNQIEVGAAGAAGGGKGGDGSPSVSSSSPKGGDAEAAFGQLGAGGRGGETGFDADAVTARGAGGGGGRFGPDAPEGFALIAEAGADGNTAGKSGVTGEPFPMGGQPGAGPFLDSDPGNDFFGRRGVYDDDGQLLELVPGELANPSAGAGGGAGGDSVASDTFPTIPFGPPFIDKKGAGGGGGGGQLRVRSLGRIVFGQNGRILAEGGEGRQGESLTLTTVVGGSSGGGSGGHVILESATGIDFSDGGVNLAAEFISTRGGVGGPGDGGELLSAGGHGGPGIVQLHVPQPNPLVALGTDENALIRLPSDAVGLGDVTAPAANVLVPTFGARSQARSVWIPLGGASYEPDGGSGAVKFRFGGTVADDGDPDAGEVLSSGGVVSELDPLLGPEALGAAPAPTIASDGRTLVLAAPSLAPLIEDEPGGVLTSDDLYLRNPALLKGFLLRLEGGGSQQRFDVAGASYDPTLQELRITVDAAGPSLESFVAIHPGASYTLVPRFFRLRTDGITDSVSEGALVRVLFQAAGVDADGAPGDPVVDWTADPSVFGSVPAEDLAFVRFLVEFDLAPAGSGVELSDGAQAVSMEFLRLPFTF